MSEKAEGGKSWVDSAKELSETQEKLADKLDETKEKAGEHEQLLLRLRGLKHMTEGEINRIDNLALSGHFKGFSANEVVDTVLALQGVLPKGADVDKPLQAALDYGYVNKFKYSLSAAANKSEMEAAVHLAKSRGQADSPEALEAQFNFLARLRETPGNEWDAIRLDTFVGGLGGVGKQMSDKDLVGLTSLQETMKPEAASAALSSGFGNLLAGKASGDESFAAHRYGLVDETRNDEAAREAYGPGWRKHRQDRVMPGALAGADVLQRSVPEWLRQYLLPILAKHGVTSAEEIKKVLQAVLPNADLANAITELIEKRKEVEDSIQRYAQQPDAATQANALRPKLPALEGEAKAQVETFATNVGVSGADARAAEAKAKIGGYKAGNKLMTDHPQAAKWVASSVMAYSDLLSTAGTFATGVLLAKPIKSLIGSASSGVRRGVSWLLKRPKVASAAAEGAEAELPALLRAPRALAAEEGAAALGEGGLIAEGVGGLAAGAGVAAVAGTALAAGAGGYIGWTIGSKINGRINDWFKNHTDESSFGAWVYDKVHRDDVDPGPLRQDKNPAAQSAPNPPQAAPAKPAPVPPPPKMATGTVDQGGPQAGSMLTAIRDELARLHADMAALAQRPVTMTVDGRELGRVVANALGREFQKPSVSGSGVDKRRHAPPTAMQTYA